MRVGLGLNVLFLAALSQETRQALLGPLGQISFTSFQTYGQPPPLSLYQYSASEWFPVALWAITVSVAIFYTLGTFWNTTRVLLPILLFSLVDRNAFAFDGGAFLALSLLIMLAFTDASSFFTMPQSRPIMRSDGSRAKMKTVTHNVFRRLIIWQIFTAYFWSSYYKLNGTHWQGGIAMRDIMELRRYQVLPALSHWIATFPLIFSAMTYGALTIQTAFPILMWSKRLKPYLVGLVVTLHIGIAVLLGLYTFSFTMVISDISLLDDDHFFVCIAFLRKVASKLSRRIFGDH